MPPLLSFQQSVSNDSITWKLFETPTIENDPNGKGEFFDSDYDSIDPQMFGSIEKDVNFNSSLSGCVSTKFDAIDGGDPHASKYKRTKFTQPNNDDSFNNNLNAFSGRIQATDETKQRNFAITSDEMFQDSGAQGTMGNCVQICNKNCLAQDEFIVFGNFIATELRNMKTDESRRKLKRAIQKCLLERAVEEDANLVECDQFNKGF